MYTTPNEVSADKDRTECPLVVKLYETPEALRAHCSHLGIQVVFYKVVSYFEGENKGDSINDAFIY